MLSVIQQDFKSYLLHNDQRVAQYIEGSSDQFITQRLAIYGDAYELRLIEALANNFAVLYALVGAEYFEKLAREYLAAYPSQHFSIRYFGHRLSDFLSITSPYADQPLFSEVARYEWALAEVIDAADATVLTVEAITTIPEEKWPYVCFHLHPSVQLIDLRWDIPALAVDPTSSALQARIAEDERLVTWVLWRKAIQAYYRPNTPAEVWMLQALQKRQAFGEICEGLCQWFTEDAAAQQAADTLVMWLHDGLISRISEL